MKSLQLSVTKLGLSTASCLFVLASLSACVKTSSPTPDLDPNSIFPKMTSSAPGSGSGQGPSAAKDAAPQAATAPTACPPALKTDYNNAMNECMSNPSGSTCLDLQKQFLNKYPNANCTFKDDDGNVNSIKVQDGHINVSVDSGDSGSGAGSSSAPSSAPSSGGSTATPVPTTPSASGMGQCSESQLLVYQLVSDCARLRVDSQDDATLAGLSTCKRALGNHVDNDSQYGCLVPASRSNSGDPELFGSQLVSDELDRDTNKYEDVYEALNPAPATPVTIPSENDSNSGDSPSYSSSDDDQSLPACSAKVIARFALYKKNTAICRVSAAKLNAHRKACVSLATVMLKAESNVACQVPARASKVFAAGVELRTADVQDDLSDFQ